MKKVIHQENKPHTSIQIKLEQKLVCGVHSVWPGEEGAKDWIGIEGLLGSG